MNSKSELIKKLSKVAKKHKILTYPILGLIAIISFFGYFLAWSKGAGKRYVAICLALVLLVSQSYFMTSSAHSDVDDDSSYKTQAGLVTSSNSAYDEMVGGNTEEVTTPSNDSSETSTQSDNTEASSPASNDESTQEGNDANVTTDNNDNAGTGDETSTEVPEDTDLAVAPTDQTEIDGAPTNCDVVFVRKNTDGSSGFIGNAEPVPVNNNTINLSGIIAARKTAGDAMYDATSYSFVAWYYDEACTEAVSDMTSVRTEGNASITIYGKWNLERYKVNFNIPGGASYSVTGQSLVGNSVYVPVSNSTLNVTGITKLGYQLSTSISSGSGYTVSNVSANRASSSFDVTFSNTTETPVYDVTIPMTPLTIEVDYATTSDGSTSVKAADYTFDDEAMAFTTPESITMVENKKGYYVSGWAIGSAAGTQVQGGALMKNYQNEFFPDNNARSVMLYPVWTKDVIEMPSAEASTFEYQYKLPAATKTVAATLQKDSGSLSYTIKTGKDTLEGLGFTVSNDSNGIHIAAPSGPNDIPGGSGEIQLTYDVECDDSDLEVKHGTITIKIVKRVIKVGNVTKPSKTYDGNKVLPTDFTSAYNGTIPSNVDGVTFNYNLTSSAYADEQAGADKQVTLAITGVNGETQENLNKYYTYDLTQVISGEIKKKTLRVVTKANYPVGRDFIRAGEAFEDFDVNFVDAEGDLIPADYASNQASILAALKPNITVDRDLDKERTGAISLPHQYDIALDSDIDTNYRLSVTVGKLNVKAEDISPGGNYKIEGTQGDNGWYVAEPVVIKSATADYSHVKVGLNNPDASATPEEQHLVYQSQFKDAPSTNYYVQLVKADNGVVNVVSNWGNAGVIKIDTEKPEFLNMTVATEAPVGTPINETTGLYFPTEGREISFGSYFKKTIYITVTYKDQEGLSGFAAGERFYYKTYADSDFVAAAMTPGANNSMYAKATFTVPVLVSGAGVLSGKIMVKAKDAAGNESVVTELKNNFDALDWSVEQSLPHIDNFYINARPHALTATDSSDQYYSNATAICSAYDDNNVEGGGSGLNRIEWTIDTGSGTPYVVTEDIADGATSKTHEKTFQLPIDTSTYTNTTTASIYTVSAKVYDNAENVANEQPSISFRIDDEDPEIHVDPQTYSKYTTEANVKFVAYDYKSGFKTAYVKLPNGETYNVEIPNGVDKTKDGYTYKEYECSFKVTENGTYTIYAEDNAGNMFAVPITVSKVSAEVPECPVLTVIPENPDGNTVTDAATGEEYTWYTTKPRFSLSNVTKCTDGMDVNTVYSFDDGTGYHPSTIDARKDHEDFDIPGNGKYTLQYFSQSYTGVKCADADHVRTFYVDTEVPNLSPIKLEKGTGATINASFTVTDDVSGVDKNSIKVTHGGKQITGVTIEDYTDENGKVGYKGSFVISEVGEYTVNARDIAGNFGGTGGQGSSIVPMSMNVNSLSQITKDSVGVSATVLKGSANITSANISYKKVTDTNFTDAYGVVVPDPITEDWAVSADIRNLEPATSYAYKIVATSDMDEVLEYVGYFRTLDANEKGVDVPGTSRYIDNTKNDPSNPIAVGLFKGSECIRAMTIAPYDEFTFENVPDGTYSAVATDGNFSATVGVTIADGAIIYPRSQYVTLLLSGKKTSVVVNSGSPDVTANNLDSLFNDDVNFTDDDKLLVESGQGTVEFRLYASLQRVTEVSPDAISSMYSVVSKDKVVGAYLDLQLVKIVTDDLGNVTVTPVHDLANGTFVSVTIPLGDLAGKPGLTVVRIHNTGDRYIGSVLQDCDGNPGTFTIESTRFSTYAVLYDQETSADDNTDTKITTEEAKGAGNANSNGDGAVTNFGGNNPGVAGTLVPITSKPGVSKDGTTATGGGSVSVGGLKSSSSAATGDASPLMILVTMMTLSSAGFVYLLRRRRREE